MLHNYSLARNDDRDDDDDKPGESIRRQIVTAVTIAGLSVLVTKLVEWGVDELRDRYGKKPDPKPPVTSIPSEAKPPEPSKPR